MAGGRHRGLRLAAGGLRDRPPASRKQLACIRRLASEIPGLDAGRLDVLANHNAHRPEEPIQGEGSTSSYTEVILLDDHHLLCIYDRIPFGWNPIPPASPQTKSVWVVRVALTRRRSFVYQSFNAACLGSGDEG